MARVTRTTQSHSGRKNLRGRLVLRQTDHGIVAQSWPRTRGPSKKPSENWWRAMWGTAAQMAARPHPLDQEFAESWSKNSPFAPRDLLTAAALGRLFNITTPDGAPWESLTAVTQNPQALLDLITDIPGSVLYRSPTGWVGLDPAPTGYILAVGTNNNIVWINPTAIAPETQLDGVFLTLNSDKPNSEYSPATPIAWEQADYDTANRWNPIADPTRITFNTDDANRVALITASFGYYSGPNPARLFIDLTLYDAANVEKAAAALNIDPPTGTSGVQLSLQTPRLAPGDWIEQRIFISTGVAVNTRQKTTHLALTMIG